MTSTPELSQTREDTSRSPRGPHRLRPGATVGRYRVLDALGRGGMSEVYAAYDPQLDRGVALKIMRMERGGDAHHRLQQEGRALARLGHRNVVTVHDVGRFGEELFVAMEHVHGTTLAGWLETERSWSAILRRLVEAGEGLVAAHAAGVIHRDFKPANVMVERETERVVVVDFGLARLDRNPSQEHDRPRAEGPSKLTESTYSAVGTPAYMAPELLQGGRATPASDQFAFCVSAYEALFGRRPFDGRHLLELAEAMAAGPRPAPERTEVPTAVVRAVTRGLSAEPDQRHPSLDALLDEFRAVLVPPRSRRGWWLAAGATAALGGALTWATLNDPQEQCLAPLIQERQARWNDEIRVQVEEALTGSGRPHAEQTTPRVIARMHRATERWDETARAACAAEPSLRSARAHATTTCLVRALTRVEVTTEQLVTAAHSPQVADHALDLVVALPDPAQCTHEVIAADDADPAGHHDDAAVIEATARSAAARVVGQASTALTHADEAVTLGQDGASGRALADAYLERGHARDATAAYDEALADYAAAAATALRFELPRRHALATMELLRVSGDRLRSFDVADHWHTLAEAATSRFASDDPLHAKLAWVTGTVKWRQGDLPAADEALARAEVGYEAQPEKLAGVLTERSMVADRSGEPERARALIGRALEIRREFFGPTHPAVADALADLAVIAGRSSQLEEALRLGRQALEIYETGVDPSHPHVATIVMNMGLELTSVGRDDEALALFDRAVKLRQQAFGDDSLLVTYARSSRAPALAAVGRMDEAVADLERVIDRLGREFGDDHRDLMAPLTSLGNLEAERGHLDRALVHHERAHAIATTVHDATHPAVGIAAQNIGELRARSGDCATARRWLEQALDIFATKLGPDRDEVGYPLTALGACDVAQGRPDDALPRLRRAVEIRAKVPSSPIERARSLLTLAEALHAADPSDPTAATRRAEGLALFPDDDANAEHAREQTLGWIEEIAGRSGFSDSTPDAIRSP